MIMATAAQDDDHPNAFVRPVRGADVHHSPLVEGVAQDGGS